MGERLSGDPAHPLDPTGVPTRAELAIDSVVLAPRLIGAVVESRIGGLRVAVRLTEVEAYRADRDPASHAYRGPTRRTAVMFGPPGHLYCYFTYGMHWCANVVCQIDGVAAAVLLRAGAVVAGEAIARERRGWNGPARELARGPARLARCLGLDAATDGVDLLDPDAPVRLWGVGTRRPRGVEVGPRVGITRAADRPWRFWRANDPTVSAFRPGTLRRRSTPEA